MPFDRQRAKTAIAHLAEMGVFVGTSSWKYPGWCGQLYDASRYQWRGKLTKTRFEKDCLSEYAEVFKTVCVDAAYYTFPTPQYLQGLASKVPSDFQFALKVTDEITVKKFPNHPRFGERAGRPNEHFLNAELFSSMFLTASESIRANVGVLMFEFSRFHQGDYERGRDFIEDLDSFLGKLPKGWPYGVEMRNRYWLRPDYFTCLARHGVAHVFNSWEAMPSVSEQRALAGSISNPELVAARLLLKPGRRYEEAVKAFQPYDKTKEVNEEARQAAAELVREGCAAKRKTFIFVNNRLEGNALETISAILDAVST